MHAVFRNHFAVECICDALFPASFDPNSRYFHCDNTYNAALHIIFFSSVCKSLRERIVHIVSDYGKNTQFETLKWVAQTHVRLEPPFRFSVQYSALKTELQYIIYKVNKLFTDVDIPHTVQRENVGYDVQNQRVSGALHLVIHFCEPIIFTIYLRNYDMFFHGFHDDAPLKQKYIIFSYLEETIENYKRYAESVRRLQKYIR